MFMENFRFMPTSLSSLVNNLSDGLDNNKGTDCKSCLEYIFMCLKFNKNHNKDFNKDLINRFASKYEI